MVVWDDSGHRGAKGASVVRVARSLIPRWRATSDVDIDALDELWRPSHWRRGPSALGAAPPGPLAGEALFYAGAAAYRVGSRWLPEAAYLPANLAATVAAVVAGRSLGLGPALMGLRFERLRRGAVVGVVAGGVAAAAVLAAALGPDTADVIPADRFQGVGIGGMLYEVLLKIPLGTALFEEVLFRGIILGLLLRRMSPLWALVVSASLFGLWHGHEALDAVLAGASESAAWVPTLGRGLATVPATAFAGLALGWLRLRGNSVVAPAITHGMLNTAAYVAGWLVAR